jgi:hypothetical protein
MMASALEEAVNARKSHKLQLQHLSQKGDFAVDEIDEIDEIVQCSLPLVAGSSPG